MTPYDVINEAVEDMDALLCSKSLCIDEEDITSCYIFHHASCLLETSRDAITLERLGRNRSSKILIRTIIENLYKISASVQNQSYPVESFIAEIDERILKMEKWCAVTGVEPKDSNIYGSLLFLEDTVSNLRKSYQYWESKRWNIFETAKVASLSWHYAGDYWLYSSYVHSSFKTSSVGDAGSRPGHMLQSIAFAVITCSGLVAMFINDESSQEVIDKSTRQLKLLTEMMQNGLFTS